MRAATHRHRRSRTARSRTGRYQHRPGVTARRRPAPTLAPASNPPFLLAVPLFQRVMLAGVTQLALTFLRAHHHPQWSVRLR